MCGTRNRQRYYQSQESEHPTKVLFSVNNIGRAVYDALVAGLEQRQKEIRVTELPNEKVMAAIRMENPQLYFVDFSVWNVTEFMGIHKIAPTYMYDERQCDTINAKAEALYRRFASLEGEYFLRKVHNYFVRTVSYDETEGKYIISNNSNLSTDLKRTGQLEIITNGYATLQEPNAIWNLKTNTSSPYTIFYGNYDIIIEIPQANNSYMIQNTGDKWTINMRSVLSYPQAYSSDDDFKSYWTAIYTVVPDTFSGSAEVLKSTKFSISPDVTTSTTMYTTDVLNIMTSSPMRYNPICGTRAFAPGGSLIVSVAEATDPSGYFSVEWLENESGCKPTVALTFQGETQEFPGNM